MRKIVLVSILVLSSSLSFSQTAAVNGFCEQGAKTATVSGLPSTNKLQGIIPGCTVTVYLTGTSTLATIYADAINTPLSSTFTANTTTGQYVFYATQGVGLDVVRSSGTTNTDVVPGVSSGAFCSTGVTGCTLTGPLNGTSATFSGTVAAGSISAAGGTMTGPLTGTSATFSGTVAAGSISAAGGTITGPLNFKILNNIRSADQFAGSDWCARVTSADTDLGSSFGEIWVSQLANSGACAAAPTLSAGHTMRFIQGGVYSISTGWTQANIGSWQIVGNTLTFINFTGSSAFLADGSAYGDGMQNIFINNIVFTGNSGIANAAEFQNVNRSSFDNMQCINATVNGCWFRAVTNSTFNLTGGSVPYFHGAAIPIQYTVFPTNMVNFDTNALANSSSFANTGNIFAEGGTGKTCIALNYLSASNITVNSAEGCAIGVNLNGAAFSDTLTINDTESNTSQDVLIAGFQNRVTLRSTSTGGVVVSGNDNRISGNVQNLNITSAASRTILESLNYSTQAIGGMITDASSPNLTTRIKVRNANTGAYEPDVLGPHTVGFSGIDSFTATPPSNAGSNGNGWRTCYLVAGDCWGVGPSTVGLWSADGQWFSLFGTALPHGDATNSTPDTAATFSVKMDTGDVRAPSATITTVTATTVIDTDTYSATINATNGIDGQNAAGNNNAGPFTLGASGIVGSGASAACAPSHSCDQFSGAVRLTTGTSITTTGLLLTVGLPKPKTNKGNLWCMIQDQSAGTMFMSYNCDTTNGATPTITFTNGSVLTASHQYEISYGWGGK